MDTIVSRTNFNRPFSNVVNQLRSVGLRPTRQRLALAKLLFDADETRHVSAEALHAEAVESDIRVSLATVYNTLHQFVDVGLLQEVVVDSNRTYFDTNTASHHHFFEKGTGLLVDIPETSVAVDVKNSVPSGMRVVSTEVVFRLEPHDGPSRTDKAVNDN
ncbi:MAG: iron response transcriptional regulator IrrA [Pseudomonadota bacterium]